MMLFTSVNAFGAQIYKVSVDATTQKKHSLISLSDWCTKILGSESWYLTASPNGWSQEANSFYFKNEEDATAFFSQFSITPENGSAN
ncbi:hypothetical protein UFOVP116_231 [uncultured Caudovirales phage]|uniref:Uncharacterized protein n=1 Tax=uncultured Caudovirales phage TaxID=2100421 RepID=A0A6J5L9M2_9CAUD|nr:hypothetical protein UFOVP116_231 [uncultured Caudovirales phage]